MKLSIETFQNLQYFWKMKLKTLTYYLYIFYFQFRALDFFTVDLDNCIKHQAFIFKECHSSLVFSLGIFDIFSSTYDVQKCSLYRSPVTFF